MRLSGLLARRTVSRRSRARRSINNGTSRDTAEQLKEIQDFAAKTSAGKTPKGATELTQSTGEFFDFSETSKLQLARKLSPGWFAPITIPSEVTSFDTYPTIEHYYQSQKFVRDNLEFSQRFATGHPEFVGDDPELARRIGSKKKINTQGQKIGAGLPRGVRLDANFKDRRDQVMKTALEVALSSNYLTVKGHHQAKFDQHPELKMALMTTGARGLVYTGMHPHWGAIFKKDKAGHGRILGKNELGALLESIRAKYMNEYYQRTQEAVEQGGITVDQAKAALQQSGILQEEGFELVTVKDGEQNDNLSNEDQSAISEFREKKSE